MNGMGKNHGARSVAGELTWKGLVGDQIAKSAGVLRTD